MPPKKGKATAKTPVKKAAAPEPPTSITTNRGKEIATTAAAGRARRSTVTEAPVEKPDATVGKKRRRPAKATAQEDEDGEDDAADATEEPPKKRGRPAKKTTTATEKPDSDAPAVKKRGRPVKANPAEESDDDATEDAPPTRKSGRSTNANTEKVAVVEVSKKSAGRPSKIKATDVEDVPATGARKKPGRPAKAKPKTKTADDTVEDDDVSEDEVAKEEAVPATAPKKKPGRPAKVKADASKAAAMEDPEEKPGYLDVPAPRKRGRPPKGGATTKIATDDAAAADQLEDELVDTADDVPAPKGNKRKAPVSKSTGRRKKAKTDVAQEDDMENEVEDNGADAIDDDADMNDAGADIVTSSGKMFWLLKAEQESRFIKLASGQQFDTKFTIDDLKAKGGPEPWDGVRNVVARNNMRRMKKGDLAFFYASGGKGKLKPGITGIMEIVSEHEEDKTVYDNDAYGYLDPSKRPKNGEVWSVVHVEFRKKLTKPVALKELQEHSKDTGALSKMQVLNATRVSVSEVSEKEWNFIHDELIEGFEEDKEADLPVDASMGDADANGDGASAETVPDIASTDAIALPSTETLKAETSTDAVDLPSSEIAPPASTNATSEVIPTITNTDAVVVPSIANALPAATSRAASRASRAGSRASSRAPYAIVQTTETTLTATLTTSTARPAFRAGSVKPPSCAGSRAPSVRPASRGRSRTPKPRAGNVSTVAEESLAVVSEEPLTLDDVSALMNGNEA